MTDAPVYLDANALIEAVEGADAALMMTIGALRKAGREIVTSELSLAEVLVKPIQEANDGLCRLYERLIVESGLVTPCPVDRDILRLCAQTRARDGGKLPDSIHVATALRAGCTVIVSSDKRLRLPDGLRRIETAAIGILANASS
ncbi:hypothetical protein ASG48_08890 [Aurantimonas sp. Leaf443]|nr:hypothetical protein ASG48_08890 [Aurantimonas sp. Leaf443]